MQQIMWEKRCSGVCVMFRFATTKCGTCEKTAFKLQELSLKGEELEGKIISVQCASCKTPIGVVDYDAKRQARISRVERRLSTIEEKLDEIMSALKEH
jgi:hypothetical protein